MAGGVFISYRREDTDGFAGRIYDRLAIRLGHDNVFFDVDAIPPGRDLVDVLSDRVGKCDALIAVIGKNWFIAADAQNRRRLNDPDDFVRIEIEAALKRDVPVIPVLVDGASMPHAEDLPDGLKKLVRRQAIEISHTRFDSDAERLIEALAGIEGALGGREGGAASPPGALPKSGPQTAPQRPAQGRPLAYFAILGLAAVAAGGLLFALLAPRHDEKRDGGGWLAREDFGTEFRKQAANGAYPDRVAARCDDGSLKINAHWAPGQPGVSWRFFGTNDDNFDVKNAELKAQGFALEYDNVFKDCQGRTRHQALWKKAGQ